MSSVYGYVKVKETNEPISGLLVSVYAKEKAEASPKVKARVSDPFELYTRSFGSTITNDKGDFRIEFDLKTFAYTSKVQTKPELMLAVFAPATAETVDRLKAPSSFERLLHWFELPRFEADQSEALVIRLLEEQLKKFDFKLPRDQYKPSIEQSVALFVKAEEDNIRFNALLREKLAPTRSEQVQRLRKITEAAKKFAAPLYATPKAARSKSNWVAFRDATDEATRANMEEGLNHIALGTALAPSRVPVSLTDEVLVDAGFFPDRITVEGLEIDHEQLCRLLNYRRAGTAMEHVRDLLEARKTKIVPNVVGMNRVAGEEAIITAGLKVGDISADYSEVVSIENIISQEPLSGTVATPGTMVNLVLSTTQEETPTVAEESALAVSRRVLGQIRDMPVADAAISTEKSQPLTAEELNALLPSVRLGAGPADVAAFHDFHHLQIAFPHVWTEAFDQQLRTEVEELYKIYTELHHEYGEEVPDRALIEEFKDLKDFLRELSGDNPLTHTFTPLLPDTERFLNQHGYSESLYRYLSRGQQSSLNGYVRAWQGLSNDDPQRSAIIKLIETILQNPGGIKTRLERLLSQVAIRLAEPYTFHYFAPDSVNFGILTTYRQRWEPGQYQVGDLVSTIPLAPGEKRKYTTKQVVKTTRAETELEKSLASKSREMTTTKRVASEIASKASLRSNFQMTSEGTFRFAIGEITAGTQFSTNQAQESSSEKKDFREAVLKAANEYKQERSLEVKTTDELTSETTSSGELSNPNNELTVTYLLYELERQYKISERIHRVTPVVLVAQDVPAPHEITESWLLAHEWILRRVLLDDSLALALDSLTDAFAGEELSVSVKKANWETQKELLEKLQITVSEILSAREKFRTRLIMGEEARARAAAVEEAQGWLSDLLENLTVGDMGEMLVAELGAKVETVKKQLDYLEENLEEKREELSMARAALEETTKAYAAALEAQTNRRVAIDQLRIHVKENILYYMQAIWDHEPPDQRFFRLYHIDVDLPEAPERTCTLRRATEEEEASGIPLIERDGNLYIIEGCEPPTLPLPGSNTKRLVEIADLDKPLGYKGNYMIFPLKTCLYLTDFMMRDFFDDYFGVRDPDLAANFTVEELVQYTEELIRDETITLTSEQREALQRMVMTKLRQPRRDSDIVVVPTGELYMEALLGEHVLLEKFKLNHRFFDMAKARAEWRETELENLRKAARLLQDEPNLEDPDVDKRIIVEGANDVNVGTRE